MIGSLGALSAIAIPALIVALTLLSGYFVVKAIGAFYDLKFQLDENEKAYKFNKIYLDILQERMGTLSTEKANRQYQNAIDKANEANEAMHNLDDRYKGMEGTVVAVADWFEDLSIKLGTYFNNIETDANAAADAAERIEQESGGKLKVTNHAVGGIIHAAGGWFEPSGTDTIPAMLTPGEMVLNAGQQANLFKQLNGGGGRGITINITGDNVFRGENDMDILIDKMMKALSRQQEKADWGMA
jgi:hypothetical protein